MKIEVISVLFIIVIHHLADTRMIERIMEDEDDEPKQHSNHHRSKRHIKRDSDLNGVENLYSCLDLECFQVRQFKIATNYTINCYKHDILITFQINTAKHRNQKSSAYLRINQQGVYISDESAGDSKTCKMIQRFFLNFYLIF